MTLKELDKIKHDIHLLIHEERKKAQAIGEKKARKQLLKDLDNWRKEKTSTGCEDNEEVEIMNYELEDWINSYK